MRKNIISLLIKDRIKEDALMSKHRCREKELGTRALVKISRALTTSVLLMKTDLGNKT
jgi:hypothetical protein